MNIDFNQLPLDARVWVYAANKKLSSVEQTHIMNQALAFTKDWSAHQVPLKTSFTIVNDVFLIFGVDVAHHDVSGCGIDKSVHLVQKWEQELNLSLFNRMQLEYLANNDIQFASKNQVLDAYSKGLINNDTLFFNKSIGTIAELQSQFKVPFKQSWAFSQIVKQNA
jgi:hypothetical protein